MLVRRAPLRCCSSPTLWHGFNGNPICLGARKLASSRRPWISMCGGGSHRWKPLRTGDGLAATRRRPFPSRGSSTLPNRYPHLQWLTGGTVRSRRQVTVRPGPSYMSCRPHPVGCQAILFSGDEAFLSSSAQDELT
ncbi:hypothetical protein C2845_PM16G00290 [Panicum miliaceum]|uniref:Uncharacterized protein n=1 Tax=Panicum miliaceum TaxID=4540 RepID=A0A3L6PXB7_PANMI|nr:hypothetical protein C2845_PM16G00290 [Panicum miliaceum]